ncbi:MAG: nuclear transport factor 2 family protein [Vicinamibacterales bacterium]
MPVPRLVALSAIVLLAWSAAACRGTAPAPTTRDVEADRAAVRALEEGVALVLARDGFDAYAALFHDGYTNWSGGPEPVDRATYLARVRSWYDAGNRAVATEMRPVSIDIEGDLAISRYVLREEFTDGTAFVGRFTSVARRTGSRWQLYRTSFTTVYRGAKASAPPLT